MAQFVVSYVNLFDNVMTMTKVDAGNAQEALESVVGSFLGDETFDSIDSIVEHLFDHDVVAGVMEL